VPDDDDTKALLRELLRQNAETQRQNAEMAAELRELREMRAALDTKPSITISAIYCEYERAKKHDRSWRLFRNLLRPLVARLGSRRACDLTPLLWSEHRSARKNEPTRLGKPPCEATLNLELFRAQHMLRWAVDSKLLLLSPLDRAEPAEALSARETWLSEDQLEHLISCVRILKRPTQRMFCRAFILIKATTGMRFNEVRNLRHDKIALDGVSELSARATKTKRRRIIAVPLRARAAIDVLPRAIGDPRIFINPERGKLFNESTLRRWFRDVAIASGLDAAVADGDVRLLPHDLRHTAASIADAKGASALDIRDMLGHTKLASTERYLHRRQAERALEMAKLMERKGPHRHSPTEGQEGKSLSDSKG
jgi:integrase